MKKKILKFFLILLILVIIGIGIFFLVKFLGNKQIIDYEITDITVTCVNKEKDVKLDEKQIIELTPYLNTVYIVKNSNFNKWDLNDKYKLVINGDKSLKITDYSGSVYFGYYNEDSVVISEDVYEKIASYCEEDQDGQKQNNG